MGRVMRTHEEVAAVIERFLDGSCGPFDWDDLLSFPIEAPDLEKLRVMLANLPLTHPPKQRGHYTNAAGEQLLRQTAEILRMKARS